MEQRLGRYIIEEQLGEGSFAWVYRGYDEELERRVALKVLKPIWMSDPQAVARFKQEARTMAKLHHPNIAVVYEVGEAEGQVFLAQFLVNGNTLSARLKEEGPMAWPQMMEMLRPVASALDFAHENGIVHRDIKPANILVDDKGQAYLGDFGLVRAAEGSVQLSASAGGMIGTPAYMAPEQWEDREISPATDVYALSCVVVEMLTGKMLFDGSTPATVMKQHLMEGPKFPEQWPEGVPDHIVEVLKRGLTEFAADRISSAGALVAELEKAEAGEVAVAAEAAAVAPEPVAVPAAKPEPAPAPAAPPPLTPAPTPPAKKSSKSPVLAIVGAVVVLLVVVGLAGIFLLGGDEAEPADESPAVAQVTEADQEPTKAPSPTPKPTEPPAVVAEPTDLPAEPEPTEEVAAEPELSADELVEQAWASFDEGNFGNAMADFDQAIELEPNNASLYDHRGWAYYNLGEYDQALADIDQAIELDPNVPVFHTDRGVVNNALEEFEPAAADFEQALALEPDDYLRADTLMNLGIALAGLGSKEDALASYQEAVAAYQAAGAAQEDYAHVEEWVAELQQELEREASTEVAAASPTATATPSPAPQPVQAKSGNFNDFETPTTWKRGDQNYGTFERSTANAHSGTSAGQLKYDFPAVSDNFVVFLTQQPLSGQPEQISAWVNGDGAGHFLNTWVKDSAGDVWQFTFGQINHTGWQQMVAPLDPAGKWPVGVISGNNTKKAIDYPISFQALILDGVPDGASSSGTIYIDDLTSGSELAQGSTTEPAGSESANSTNSGQYLLQLGGQHVYEEPWGGDNGDPCRAWETGVFDDTNPNFRGFNVELMLTNNSSNKVSDDWAEDLFFVTANGEELVACPFSYAGMGPPPGASTSVTFFSVVPKDDYVSEVDLFLEGEEVRLCLDGKGGSSQC